MRKRKAPKTKSQGGKKFDQNFLEKPPLDLIPHEAIWEMGRVLGMGAHKYGRSNWSKGINYSRLISSAMRHLQQFNNCEDTDTESGLSHLAHSMVNLAFLLWMKNNRPDLDDRWKKSTKK